MPCCRPTGMCGCLTWPVGYATRPIFTSATGCSGHWIPGFPAGSTAKTLMWVVTALPGRSAADAALSGAVVSRDGHSGFLASAAAAALATVLSLFQHGPDSHD